MLRMPRAQPAQVLPWPGLDRTAGGALSAELRRALILRLLPEPPRGGAAAAAGDAPDGHSGRPAARSPAA